MLPARSRPLKGERLAIVTNGGGPGVLATDALIEGGGRLAELSPETVQKLDGALPATWSRANPLDVIGDAGADRYAAALQGVLEDKNIDAVLVLQVPTAISSSTETAKAVVRGAAGSDKNILTSWLGEKAVRANSAAHSAATRAYRRPGRRGASSAGAGRTGFAAWIGTAAETATGGGGQVFSPSRTTVIARCTTSSKSSTTVPSLPGVSSFIRLTRLVP